jgi:predicted DNA binding protein
MPMANATKPNNNRQRRDETTRRNRREVKRRVVLSASDQAKLQALTPQQRLVVEDALAFFPRLTLDEILSELSLLM